MQEEGGDDVISPMRASAVATRKMEPFGSGAPIPWADAYRVAHEIASEVDAFRLEENARLLKERDGWRERASAAEHDLSAIVDMLIIRKGPMCGGGYRVETPTEMPIDVANYGTAVALVRRAAGLDRDEPERAPADCSWCNGGGWTERLPGGGRIDCPLCRGTGVEIKR